MANLFENLQTYKESINKKSLKLKKEAMSPDTYNQIVRALNKDNQYKDQFIFTINASEMSKNTYRMAFYIKIAAVDDISDFDRERAGIGAGKELYVVRINIIDETIEVDKAYGYRNEDEVIHKISLKTNIDDDEIKKMTELAIENLQKLFNQKNFYYRMTNKRQRYNKWDGKYKLTGESKLQEDFDPSMPNWLMKAVRLYWAQNGANNDSQSQRYPLDKAKWEITDSPKPGRLDYKNDIIAVLIDKSGDRHEGEYMVYSPALNLGYDNNTIYINGRDRNIGSMSVKSLAPYIKQYAYVSNYDEIKDIVSQKRQQRADNRPSVQRKQDMKYVDYHTTFDKSGYPLNPEKYKRLLAQNNAEKYVAEVDKLYDKLIKIQNKLKQLSSNDDFIGDPKNKNHGNFYKVSRAYKNYESAISNYNNALGQIEHIKNNTSEYDWLRTPAYKKFKEYLDEAYNYIDKCINEIGSLDD